MNKQQKLSLVVGKLQQLSNFLESYLPLANVHNSNFIVSRHWDAMIPEKVALELLQLDDFQLAILPAGEIDSCISSKKAVCAVESSANDVCCFAPSEVELHSVFGSKSDSVPSGISLHRNSGNVDEGMSVNHSVAISGETLYSISTETNYGTVHNVYPLDSVQACSLSPQHISCEVAHAEADMSFSCSGANDDKFNPVATDTDTFCQSAESVITHKELSKCDRSQVPDWQHQSLREFIMSAVSFTLPQLGLVTSLEELSDVLELRPSDKESHIVVSHAMKIKKSHEVDIMSNLCARIAKRFNNSCVSSSFAVFILIYFECSCSFFACICHFGLLV